MKDFDYFVWARTIHVVAVVLWIGGVAFITAILLPALQQHVASEQRIQLFEQLEHKFSWQAKLTTLATGLSGFYMLMYLDAWQRYLEPQFWWLHLMTFVWLVFSLVLFIFEPLFLHHWFLQQAKKDADKTFLQILTMHRILLTLSLVAIAGAVLGAHGYVF